MPIKPRDDRFKPRNRHRVAAGYRRSRHKGLMALLYFCSLGGSIAGVIVAIAPVSQDGSLP